MLIHIAVEGHLNLYYCKFAVREKLYLEFFSFEFRYKEKVNLFVWTYSFLRSLIHSLLF